MLYMKAAYCHKMWWEVLPLVKIIVVEEKKKKKLEENSPRGPQLAFETQQPFRPWIYNLSQLLRNLLRWNKP